MTPTIGIIGLGFVGGSVDLLFSGHFDGLAPDEFERILEPLFEIERRTEGRTDIYVCRKRG
mgnify:CR=1 FL=1